MGLAERLKGMQDTWNAGKEGRVALPDGQYLMQLQSAVFEESQSTNKLMIHREHLVREGEFAGEVLHDYLVLESEYGMRNTADWLEKMGMEPPEEVDAIEKMVQELNNKNPIYTASVKKAKDSDFRNVRILELKSAEAEVEKKQESVPAAAPVKKQVKKVAQEVPTVEEEEEEAAAGEVQVGSVVTFNDGEKDVEGEVQSIAGERLEVKVGDDVYELALDELTGIVEAFSEEQGEPKAEASAAEETDEELSVMIAFAQSQNIAVDENTDKESLKKKLLSYQWDPATLTKDEKEFLEMQGAQFLRKPAPARVVTKKSTPVASPASVKKTAAPVKKKILRKK